MIKRLFDIVCSALGLLLLPVLLSVATCVRSDSPGPALFRQTRVGRLGRPFTIKGQLVGTLNSAATVFSFCANKTMTTGEGAMLVTRDPALATRAKVRRLHGINRDAFDRFTAKVRSWYCEIMAPALRYSLTDFAAAMGLRQLKKAQGFQVCCQAIADAYLKGFDGLPVALSPAEQSTDAHSWNLCVLRLTADAPVDRDTFIDRLYPLDIGCSVHYLPLHEQPYWRDRYQLTPNQFMHSEMTYWQDGACCPYSAMDDASVTRVIGAVHQALRTG